MVQMSNRFLEDLEKLANISKRYDSIMPEVDVENNGVKENCDIVEMREQLPLIGKDRRSIRRTL